MTWKNAPYVIVDVEGNGHQPPDLVEVAAAQGQGGEIRPVQSWLIRPKNPISPFVTRIHGISNSDVQDYPLLEEVAGEIQQTLNGRYLIAHNASVEKNILSRQINGWNPLGVVDTIHLSKIAFGKMKSYSLDSLSEYLQLTVPDALDGGRHRAEHDVLLTYSLFQQIINKLTDQGNEDVLVKAFGGTNQSKLF